MMPRRRPTIHPITRSPSAKKKSLTSASPPSTFSTRKERRPQRKATFSWPVVADAVAAVAAAVVADVVVAAAAAVAASAGAPAAHPGAHAAGAKRGHLPRVIEANNHGRVRHRRPGLCMCSACIARIAIARRHTPQSRRILQSPTNICAPAGLGDSASQRISLHLQAGVAGKFPCADP